MLSLKEFFSKPQREARLFQWFHALSVALLLAVGMRFVFRRTTLGYRIEAVGAAPEADIVVVKLKQAKGMNPGILVQKVEFLDHAVRVTMVCDSYDSLKLYQTSLLNEDYFSMVLTADLVTADHQVKTSMTCLFA